MKLQNTIMRERKIPHKLTVRAFSSTIVKILAFTISKHYFTILTHYFTIYQTSNILFFLQLQLNIIFLFFLYVFFVLSLCFQITTINYHVLYPTTTLKIKPLHMHVTQNFSFAKSALLHG